MNHKEKLSSHPSSLSLSSFLSSSAYFCLFVAEYAPSSGKQRKWASKKDREEDTLAMLNMFMTSASSEEVKDGPEAEAPEDDEQCEEGWFVFPLRYTY